MRGVLEEVCWWRQTAVGPFPASAAALTRKAAGRRACVGRAGRLRARQHSQRPRQRVVEPLLPCAKTYISGAQLHVRIISLVRKWWRGGRALCNHACGNELVVGKIISSNPPYSNIALLAEKLHQDCQCHQSYSWKSCWIVIQIHPEPQPQSAYVGKSVTGEENVILKTI